jgi:ABC-2 type transport system permease protein
MKKFKALVTKELYQLFHSPTAWIFTVVFILINNFFYFNNLFLIDQATMRPFFSNLSLVLMLFVPILVMGSFSSEKKVNTLEILLSLPVKKSKIVLAKLVSFSLFFCFVLMFTLTVPLTLSLISIPDFGPIISSYFGTLLLGIFYAAVGIFISSLFEEQIVTALLTGIVLFVFNLLGQQFILTRVPFALQFMLTLISPQSHYSSFIRGVINLSDVFYFITLTALFSWLSVKKVGFEE